MGTLWAAVAVLAVALSQADGAASPLFQCYRSLQAGRLPAAESAGWRLVECAPLGALACTIPRLREPAAASAAEVEQPFILAAGSPLIGDNRRFRAATARDTMASRFGRDAVVLSTPDAHSSVHVKKPLGRYLQEDVDTAVAATLRYYGADDAPLEPEATQLEAMAVKYHFGSNNFSAWPDFFEHYKRPMLYESESRGSLSFGVAGATTGVPFHTHGAVFAEVLHGRKHWFFAPPHLKPVFQPGESTFHWYERVARSFRGAGRTGAEVLPDGAVCDGADAVAALGVQQCTLHPGEVLFIPSDWYHATLNLDECVFMSTFL